MRFVAEYVMRGRTQALWVAVIGASSLMFSWLSAAVLALVTLRRGPTEGVYILAWAVLPAGFLLAVFGDIGPLAMITGTTALACVLRWSASWPFALLGASLVGTITGLGMLWLAESHLRNLAAEIAEILPVLLEVFSKDAQTIDIAFIAGMLGLMNVMSCVLCLLLARWWQSVLYNPGGFRTEFHSIRLTALASTVLVLLMLSISSMSLEYRPWAAMFGIPLSVAGLALVHARAAYRGLGAGWLTVFYVLWVFVSPVSLIVIGIAVADSYFDFRSRWKQLPAKDEDKDSDNE